MNARSFMAMSENVVLIVSHHTCDGANLLSQPQSHIGRLIRSLVALSFQERGLRLSPRGTEWLW